MANRIPFPAAPNDGDFYTDPSDMRWQWSEFKHRWSFKPLNALSTAFQTSTTTPTSTELPWYNPDDGTLSIWDADNAVWVVASGAGTDGEDGEDLTEIINPDDIATEEHTFSTGNLGKYLCFTFAGAKSAYIPVSGATFSPEVGSLLTIRNDSSTGDITVSAVGDVPPVIKAFSGGNTVAPDSTAQYLYRGDEVWHLL